MRNLRLLTIGLPAAGVNIKRGSRCLAAAAPILPEMMVFGALGKKPLFDPAFSPDEVKGILTALADYYRATGGAGFELDLEAQEAPVAEPIHV